MKRCALIGYPLGHSLSPEIHRRLFALDGIEAGYTLDPIPPERFSAEISRALECDALNVTIPYKRDVIPYLDELTPEAKLYGTVNFIHRDENGMLIGDNTDCGGFLRTMAENGVSLKSRICVLGAGGVGRMFAIECARQGGDVTVAVREGGMHRAAALCDEIRSLLSREIKVREMTAFAREEHMFELVINATPVGMFPNTGASPLPPEFFHRVTTAFDCVYNPTETLLLRQARQAGCKTVGGMPMLVHQAALAHERWFGTSFASASLSAIVLEMEGVLARA